jgi:fatty acid-binding protein DegV
MVALIRQQVGEGGRIRVAFTHVAAEEQVELLKQQVCEQFECVEVWVSQLSPALAVHSGPGTVGISFIPA